MELSMEFLEVYRYQMMKLDLQFFFCMNKRKPQKFQS